jgi:hypothetical protein
MFKPMLWGYWNKNKPLSNTMVVIMIHNHNSQTIKYPIFIYNLFEKLNNMP